MVGVVATIALVLLIVGALWLARGGLSSGYPLYARFPWGAGLKQGQPVLLAGVNIGIVDRIEFKQEGYVVVDLAIQKEHRVPLGTKATVEPNGLFGDMLIALRPEGPNPRSFQPGDTVPSGRPAASIADLTARGDSIARSVNQLAKTMESEFAGPNGGIAEMRVTMRQFNRLAAQLSTIAAQQSAELTRTQLALRKPLSAIDSATIESTLTSLRASSANVEKLTSEFQKTTDRLNSVMAKVDTGGGTAGKLVNDTLLYSDVRKLVQRMDSLATEFQKNPRKFINLTIF
jgi:phospholipid/cholesterol/gamma-HCH transport system substrate-binding protein